MFNAPQSGESEFFAYVLELSTGAARKWLTLYASIGTTVYALLFHPFGVDRTFCSPTNDPTSLAP